MDETVKVEFDRVHDENKRQNVRIEKLEQSFSEMHEIALSVQKLAINMDNMLKELQKQGDRLNKLENEPAEAWTNAKKTVFNTILGAFAGALAVGLIMLVSKGI